MMILDKLIPKQENLINLHVILATALDGGKKMLYVHLVMAVDKYITEVIQLVCRVQVWGVNLKALLALIVRALDGCNLGWVSYNKETF